MITMDPLEQLAMLISQYNEIGGQIAKLIGRPAQIGHAGEYIASKIFDVRLEHLATTRAIDGRFASGPLTGRSVNIKWYAKQENLLNACVGLLPDYYLVLAGPPSPAATSRGGTRPWLIRSVYLFAGAALHEELIRHDIKVGIATSMRKSVWEAAMIYPDSRSPAYRLSEEQRRQLALFW